MKNLSPPLAEGLKEACAGCSGEQQLRTIGGAGLSNHWFGKIILHFAVWGYSAPSSAAVPRGRSLPLQRFCGAALLFYLCLRHKIANTGFGM